MFSIIVPFYNPTYFRLDNCLKSIEYAIKQSSINESEFELILIDDGSNFDYTQEIINILNMKYKFFRNKENLGVGASRKIGIKESTQKWICFIDSDDTINENYFINLINYIEDDLDFILFERNFKNEEKIFTLIGQTVFGRDKAMSLTNHKLTPFWSKCYNRKFLENISIKDDRINEDILPHLQLMNNVNKFKIISFPMYHYIPLESGVSNNNIKNFYIINILNDAVQYIEENNMSNFSNYIIDILKLEKNVILTEEVFEAVMVIAKNTFLKSYIFKFLTEENKKWLIENES